MQRSPAKNEHYCKKKFLNLICLKNGIKYLPVTNPHSQSLLNDLIEIKDKVTGFFFNALVKTGLQTRASTRLSLTGSYLDLIPGHWITHDIQQTIFTAALSSPAFGACIKTPAAGAVEPAVGACLGDYEKTAPGDF
jgi:hypothetical protein